MAEKTKTTDKIMKLSSDTISDLIDVNTVIGDPIVTPSGMRVIPFTKVTIGHVAGSGEYGDTKIIEDDSTRAGASGLLVHIKPEGFLVDDGKTCRLLNVTDDPAGALIEKATEWLANFSKGNEGV